MSRKNKRSAGNSPAEKACQISAGNAAPCGGGGITANGARLLAAAVVIIISGYISLSKASPYGRDTWSTLAALLLIGGYLLIPFAIMAGKNEPGGRSPL